MPVQLLEGHSIVGSTFFSLLEERRKEGREGKRGGDARNGLRDMREPYGSRMCKRQGRQGISSRG